MSIALDYTGRIDPAALKAAGVSDVFRYLSWMNYWGGVSHNYPNPKIIQKAEYDELLAAGIAVTLNWEYDAKDWLSGSDGGAAHALEACKQARALGYPAGATIIGSADFDMTRQQWDGAGHAYAVAFGAGIRAGGYTPGVYGPYDVLTWCANETGLSRFWQAGMSWAWSGQRNRNRWPGAHVRQMNHRTVGGRDTDWNEILIPDWGQHRLGGLSMASEQLLNGWAQPVTSSGEKDGRGVGIWVAEGWRYLWDGVGAYDKGSADPSGPPSGFYLDRLLKLIRDEQRGSHNALAGALAALAEQRTPTITLTRDELLGAVTAAVHAVLPAALEEALGGITLKVEQAA